MSMICKFVNSTTALPVDKSIEKLFFSIVKQDFLEAYLSNWMPKQFSNFEIFFACPDDADLVKQNKEENGIMDLLGVYFSHHPSYHRPIIKISPEKVMDYCLSSKVKHKVSLPLSVLYPTMLIAVIIHEIAHACMDEKAGPHSQCDAPWNWIEERLNKEDLHTLCDYYDEPGVENKLKLFDLIPSSLRGSCSYCDYDKPRIDLTRKQWRHLIEESLANAFILNQNFNTEQMDVIKLLMNDEPPGYKAGLLWEMNLAELLTTARSWRSSKVKYFGHDGAIYFKKGVESPLELLIKKFDNVQAIPPCDFEHDLDCYIEAHNVKIEWRKELKDIVSSWQQENLNDVDWLFSDEPSYVIGDFVCNNKQLETLGNPRMFIIGSFYCRNNELKDLHNICKKIKYIGNIADFRGNPIQSQVLGLLEIKGLKKIYLDNKEVEKIINKHLEGERDLLECQDDLRYAGLKQFASY